VQAFVITAPGQASVEEVAPPLAGPGEVIVDVGRAGVCGTDVEFFTGEMQYLHNGLASYPMRIGHEWMGSVSAAGEGVDRGWIGRRVTGDTMLGCGACYRCRDGRHHVCAFRTELGISGGRPGALAGQVAVPVTALRKLPDQVDDLRGALVEPGGNALRAVRAAALRPGGWLLVEDADTELQPLACLDESGPAQRRANRLRRAFRELMTRRGADLRYGRTLPGALREAGLADVAAAGSFPVGGAVCDRLEIASMRQVRAELVAAGLADEAEIDAHIAAIDAGELDLTLAPLVSAWGRRPG